MREFWIFLHIFSTQFVACQEISSLHSHHKYFSQRRPATSAPSALSLTQPSVPLPLSSMLTLSPSPLFVQPLPASDTVESQTVINDVSIHLDPVDSSATVSSEVNRASSIAFDDGCAIMAPTPAEPPAPSNSLIAAAADDADFESVVESATEVRFVFFSLYRSFPCHLYFYFPTAFQHECLIFLRASLLH